MRASECDGEEVKCSSSRHVDRGGGGGQDSGDSEELSE